MKKLFESVFERCGEPVCIERRGESWETKAVIQPVRRERVEEPFTVTPLGAAEERIWRYLGPAETPVAMGDLVRWNGKAYRVRNAAAVHALGETAYHWALLVPEEESV